MRLRCRPVFALIVDIAESALLDLQIKRLHISAMGRLLKRAILASIPLLIALPAIAQPAEAITPALDSTEVDAGKSAADRLFVQALCAHVSGPPELSRELYAKAASAHWRLWKVDDDLPEPGSYYDTRSEAKAQAQAAIESGNFSDAEIPFFIALGFTFGDTSTRLPPELFDQYDIFEFYPLIEALIMAGASDRARAMADCMMGSPDPEVRKALLRSINNQVYSLNNAETYELADAFALMGLTLLTNDAEVFSSYKDDFDQQLKSSEYRRVMAAVPDELEMPDITRPTPEERKNGHTLLLDALAEAEAGNWTGAEPKFVAVAQIYASAWGADLQIPQLDAAQQKLYMAAYRLIEPAEKEGRLEELEVIHHFYLALRFADRADERDAGLTGDDAYAISKLALTLAQLGKIDEIGPFARLLANSPIPEVRATLPYWLSREAQQLLADDQLDPAEKLARFGLDQYADEESEKNGTAKQFERVLDSVLAKRPLPAILETLAIPDPSRLTQQARHDADALFLDALQKRIAGDLADSQPKFLAAAQYYLAAWSDPIEIPEYRMHQITLATAASAVGNEAAQAGQLDEADIALRFAQSIRLAEASVPSHEQEFDILRAVSVGRIGNLLFRQGRVDASAEIYSALMNANDPEVVADVANDFVSEAYMLKKSGALDRAELAAKFGLDLFGGKSGNVRHAYARLARMYGEILTQKDQPDAAAPWLAIGWDERNKADAFESSQAAEAIVANLLRLGRIDEARPIISSQITAPGKIEFQTADWVLSLSKNPLHGFTVKDRLAMRQFALDILEQNPPREKYLLIDSLHSLAGAHFDLGQMQEAEALYRRALAISEGEYSIDSGSSEFNLQGLAATLTAVGRVDEASALFGRYWQIIEQYDDPDPAAFEDTLRVYLNILLQQERNTEADDISDRALRRFSAMPSVSASLHAEFELDRAFVLYNLGRIDEAQALVRAANNRHSSFRSRNLLALILETQGQPAEAEPLRRAMLEEVEQHLFEGPYSESRLAALSGLANNIAMQGRTADADAIYSNTVKLLSDVFGVDSAQYADQAENYAKHLLGTGRLAQARSVAQSVLSARVATDNRSGASASDTTKLALARARSRAAGLYLRTLYLDKSGSDDVRIAQAFETLQWAETSAAGLALARSASNEAAQAIGAGDAASAWREAQTQLAVIDQRIADAAARGEEGDADRLAASRERPAIIASVKQAETVLNERFPRFFDMISSQPLKLEELQGENGLLRNDEALIILNPGDINLTKDQQIGSIYVVTRDATAWTELPLNNAQLADTIKRFHSTLNESGETEASDFPAPTRFFSRRESFDLFQKLFGNPEIAALITTKQRWTLAPQGVFASLPFAALVTEAPIGDRQGDVDPAILRKTQWLGAEKALAVTPTVAAIGIQRRYAKSTISSERIPFFGLGDPAFKGIADPPLPQEESEPAERGGQRDRIRLSNNGAYFRGGTANLQAINKLDRLIGTSREIRMLAKLLSVGDDSIALQMAASEAEIRRRNANGTLGKTDVIVFATHGLLANELAGSNAEPALALTPPAINQDQLSPQNDGLLTASEAALLDLSARFVILSACNTAASGKPDAESLSGLARAFFYAGAQSLLVTHYYVQDRAAPLLTSRTIEIVNSEGLDTAEAMRRSIVALIGNTEADPDGLSFAHPKAWAPFAVIDAN